MKKLPEIIDENELIEIIKETPKPYQVAFLLGFYQGLRISEICGLKQEISPCCNSAMKKTKENKQIKYSCAACGKEIEINKFRRGGDWKIKPITAENFDFNKRLMFIKGGKGEKDRNIPIHPKILPRYASSLPVTRTRRIVQNTFSRIAKKVLGKDMHFHCLRHSAGVYYLKQWKGNIRMVQQFLGHSSITSTQIYTQVSPDDLLNAMEGLK